MASIRKAKTKSGEARWVAHYRDPSGKPREKWFLRKIDAEQYARRIATDVDRGRYTDPRAGKISFAEWSASWLNTKADRKPKTLEGYRSLLDNHVLPVFGPRSLSSIRPEEISVWIANLKLSGLSASRVRQAFNVLNGCLGMAAAFDRIPRNPAANVAVRSTIPSPVSGEMKFLSLDQLLALTDAAPQPYETLIMTLGISGIRWGEAVALRRRRIDLLGKRLHIAESMAEVKGGLSFGSPKSGHDRWVNIPAFLRDDLEVRLQSVAPDPDALVFTTATKTPLRNSNFTQRIWRPTLNQAGLPTNLRIHDMRHTAASLMIAEGAPITLVQRQLGHSSVVTTQRYAHLYPTQGEELGDRLDQTFRSARRADVGLGVSRLTPIAQ